MTDTAPLIPGTEPPPKRRRNPHCWTADERQFADRMLVLWNQHLAPVAGRAFDVRGNRGAAVRFYRRNCARHEAERFTESMISAALAAYADCSANVKLQSWKTFRDFFTDAEDLLSKHLVRSGVSQVPPDARRMQIEARLETLSLGRLAEQATRSNTRLTEHLEYLDLRERKAARAGVQADVSRTSVPALCMKLVDDWKWMPRPGQNRLLDLARTEFRILRGRLPTAELADTNLLGALTLSRLAAQRPDAEPSVPNDQEPA